MISVPAVSPLEGLPRSKQRSQLPLNVSLILPQQHYKPRLYLSLCSRTPCQAGQLRNKSAGHPKMQNGFSREKHRYRVAANVNTESSVVNLDISKIGRSKFTTRSFFKTEYQVAYFPSLILAEQISIQKGVNCLIL